MSKRVHFQGTHKSEKVTGVLKKRGDEYYIVTKFEQNPETFEIPIEEFLEDFENKGITLKVQSSPWGEGLFKNNFPEGGIEFSNCAVRPEYKYASEAAYEKFQDMKFGMMIHWGFYSQLGITESWCANGSMTDQEFFDVYYTLWQVFNPVEFNADEWAALAQRAGMQFFQFTTKHHDGFCMFDTKTETMARKRHPTQGPVVGRVIDEKMHFGIMDTLFKRDIVGELITAFRKRKLGVGLYYSNIDWNDPNFRWHNGSRVFDPDYGPRTHPEEWNAMVERQRVQLREIFSNYGEIDQMFFDGGWPFVGLKEMEEIILMCRKLQPNCMMSDRGLGPYGDFTSPERWIPKSADDERITGRRQKLWQVCDPIHGSWAYLPGDVYKGKEELLHNLIDAISKGGTYVFAISPMSNGKFPAKTIEILEYMGDWLKVNGEAVYNTRKWKKSKEEGQEIFYTQSKDGKYLYVSILGSAPDKFVLTNLEVASNASAIVLGSNEKILLKVGAKGVVVELTDSLKKSLSKRPGFALKIPLA